jgi:hypothetical protein
MQWQKWKWKAELSMNTDQRHDLAKPVSTLRVVEVDPQSDPRWEALMTALPSALIYHHPAWLQVIEEACGYKPVNLACEDTNGQLRGILPLFYKRGFLKSDQTRCPGSSGGDRTRALGLVQALRGYHAQAQRPATVLPLL